MVSAREPGSSQERPRSLWAPRAREWSPATSSTPHRASSPPRSPARCSSAKRRDARRRRRSPTRRSASTSSRARPRRYSCGARFASRRAGWAPSSSSGLEAPFVGRDRELRLVKELFHASAEEGKAQLVTITGIAGIGKSRLSWEFEKYIDGLADDQFWHRGRCLSYGEGVAYFALAEMVRMRCDIAEDEDPAAAREKLRATLAEHLSDPEERAWVEPRLAHLLGLEEGAPGDQENLFSAWRILFERLAETSPTILVFEDMQWADSGLLDFLEYLLEWSRAHPLFVLVLARPELADKRPAWGGGKRSFASIYLEPLSPQAMDELLTGLVPGLPEDVRDGCPRARRRRPPLRGRDRAHAARPRPRSSAKATPTARPVRSASSRCPRRCTLSSRLVSTGLRPRSGASSKTEPCSGRRSRGSAWHRSPDSRSPTSSRSSARSCARKSSRSRPTPAPPSAASTRSSRTSCATSPTRRSRSGSARPNTSAPRSSSSRCRARTRVRSSR